MNIEDIATKKDLAEMEKRILKAMRGTTKADDSCINIDDAARYIGAKNRSTIYKLTSSGKLAYHKVGKMNAFRKADLDNYLARHRKSSSDEIETAASSMQP